ncbi:MAG: methylmalonyl-CoA mutase, partial [Thermoproteota archaeon]
MREVEEWESKLVQEYLRKLPERKKEFKTPSGIPLKRVYTPLDIKGTYLEKLGLPGKYPYTRGIHPTMYRARIWTMR